ncbi:Toxin-antitoxin system (modular protein) [Candidatus Nitrosotenuis uzonensis]|uniref:Toxin-antitoxin system (Modular protein) n=1 Tax=Candidatus Nitrosotenuis uzonensis TaxID=1407055 RepID=V6AV38_9ARCH|nr:Toxin-antitoxin system (modular protein) [Candidatus Nitrosotenuis uzonensis]
MKGQTKLKTVNVSAKGQIAIPADVRRCMGLEKETGVCLRLHGKKFLLKNQTNLQKTKTI